MPVSEVEDFVASDRTDYHKGQLRTNALEPMERNGLIEVDESTRKKRYKYPPGTKLRFL
jgi:hypothetical protein